MHKTIKQFFNLFLPPVLGSKLRREFVNSIFYKNKINHKYEYENNFYNRIAYINKAISKYKNCKYLEIGVDNNEVFNSIPLKNINKFGVDPVKGGNYKMTSDNFFKKYKDIKFNVVFIDGLHEYYQCQKDCMNSINQLENGGVIIIHDFLPRSNFEEKLPRSQSNWTGDVWKVAVELSQSENAEFRIVNIDMGIGILKLNKNFKYKIINELKNKTFEDFLEYKKNLPIISAEEGLDFI